MTSAYKTPSLEGDSGESEKSIVGAALATQTTVGKQGRVLETSPPSESV
jgi:hypothetical protein